jgi:hypothetical protein
MGPSTQSDVAVAILEVGNGDNGMRQYRDEVVQRVKESANNNGRVVSATDSASTRYGREELMKLLCIVLVGYHV